MKERPISITLVGWLFIAAGLVGLAYHAMDLRDAPGLNTELVWVLVLRLLAAVGGVFLLRGRDWARWLLVLWLAYHVGLSVLHTPLELAVHSALFAGILFLLFRPPARAFFRPANRGT